MARARNNTSQCAAPVVRVKFAGTVSIEYEANPADPSPDMKKCVAYASDAAKKLG
jgi:hypothetical protein